jgi:hypothetical protein
VFFPGVLAQLFFSTFFHVLAVFVYRTYSPGSWTSLLLYPPLSFYLAALAIREWLMDSRSLAAVAAAGGALHPYLVNRQVFDARSL